MDFLKNYFVNFWIWWYLVRCRAVGRLLLRRWMFTLGYLNVVPMISNLFVPLYQDYSNIGILISIPIRIIWVVSGSFIQLIITIPLVVVMAAYLVLPLLPVYGLARFFTNFL